MGAEPLVTQLEHCTVEPDTVIGLVPLTEVKHVEQLMVTAPVEAEDDRGPDADSEVTPHPEPIQLPLILIVPTFRSRPPPELAICTSDLVEDPFMCRVGCPLRLVVCSEIVPLLNVAAETAMNDTESPTPVF